MQGPAMHGMPAQQWLMAGSSPMQVGSVSYERQPIADHAINLASTIQNNLKRSLEAIGVVCAHMPLIAVCNTR